MACFIGAEAAIVGRPRPDAARLWCHRKGEVQAEGGTPVLVTSRGAGTMNALDAPGQPGISPLEAGLREQRRRGLSARPCPKRVLRGAGVAVQVLANPVSTPVQF